MVFHPEHRVLADTQLMLAPEASTTHPGHFFHNKLSPVQPGSWAQKEENRQALWGKITQMIEVQGAL